MSKRKPTFSRKSPTANQPAFGTALRILIFRREALARTRPWPLREAAEYLEVHPKTVKRYVHLLALIDHDEAGRPFLALEKRNGLSCIIVRMHRGAHLDRPEGLKR